MSRVVHILVLLQQASYEYEELVDLKKILQELLQQPFLDQREREALQEIQSYINERIEDALGAAFGNQLFVEAEANAFNYDVGFGGRSGCGGHEEAPRQEFYYW